EHYSAKEFLQTLQTCQLVLEKKLLYQSNFNKLYLTAGQYRFRYEAPSSPNQPDSDGWDAPIDDLPVQSKDPLPQLSGVLLDLQNARFAIVSAGDSVVFGPSSGSVALHEGIFVGQGGRFDWKSAGDSLIYAERSEEHTSELQSRENLVCRLLLEKKKKTHQSNAPKHTSKDSTIRRDA